MNRFALTTMALVIGVITFGAAAPAQAQDFGFSIGTDRGGFSIQLGGHRHHRHQHTCHPGCGHEYRPPIVVEVQEFVGYSEEKVLVGYDTEQVFVGYEEQQVLVGYDTEQVKTGWRTERVFVGYRTEWVSEWDGHCWHTVPRRVAQFEERQVPCYETRQVPRYECRQVPKYETRQVPRYECRQVPKYRTVRVTAHWHANHGCYGYFDGAGAFHRVQR